MAELSPAQVVLKEFWSAPVSPARNLQIAAALRALAAGYSENLYDQNEGKVAVVRSDLAIATELEGAS